MCSPPQSLPSNELHSRDCDSQLKTDQFAIIGAYRFFLAMVVCCGHVSSMINPNDWTYYALWLNQGSATFGFFVISGYTIAYSLNAGARGYVKWRFSRIYPVYFANLILALIVCSVIGSDFSWPHGSHVPPPTAIEIIGTILGFGHSQAT